MTPSAALSSEIIAGFREPFSWVSPTKNRLVVKRVSDANISYRISFNFGKAIGISYCFINLQE